MFQYAFEQDSGFFPSIACCMPSLEIRIFDTAVEMAECITFLMIEKDRREHVASRRSFSRSHPLFPGVALELTLQFRPEWFLFPDGVFPERPSV